MQGGEDIRLVCPAAMADVILDPTLSMTEAALGLVARAEATERAAELVSWAEM